MHHWRHSISFWTVLALSLLTPPNLASAGPVDALGLAVPAYSSLPGAPHTLYLDFDGMVYPGSWSSSYDPPGTVAAYDTDGNPSSFSSTELANIENIWGRVAEMYSPFNLNVTTVAPGSTPAPNSWSQIVITPTSAWCGYYGGISYVGGFAWGGIQSGTGWAFSNNLSGGNPKPVAIAVAHEAGTPVRFESPAKFQCGWESEGGVPHQHRRQPNRPHHGQLLQRDPLAVERRRQRFGNQPPI